VARGIFLAFEGIDGSGKSTQARRVAKDRAARLTFEPGDTPLGATLRSLLLDVNTAMEPVSEALLMLADRAHHVSSLIEPELAAGRHVVSDRFLASTLAYQGYGRGVDLDLLHRATDLAVDHCRPDLTILLDLSVQAAGQRRARSSLDRFESSGDEFHSRVRDGFLTLASNDPENWFVVDATLNERDVARLIDERLSQLAWTS
jgi:dTMP kinase